MTQNKGLISRFLLDYITRYRKLVVYSLCLMFFVALSRMAPPYILKVAIDRYIMRGDLYGLSTMALLYLSFICIEYISIYGQIYITQLFGQSVIRDMRLATFNHILGLPVPYFDKTPHGKSLHYMTSDMENINEFITSGIVTTIGDVITVIGIVFVMLYLSLPLTGVVFFFLLLLFAGTNIFRKRFKEAYRENRDSVSEMNAFMEENLAGVYVSKAFHREQADSDTFQKRNRRYTLAYRKVIFYLSLYFPFVESIGTLSILGIIWGSSQLLFYGSITFGTIVAFIEYSHKLYNPVRDLSEKYNLYQNALSSLEKLHSLHTMEQEERAGDATDVTGDIEFKDVWLSYEQDDVYALKGINLTIRQGERIGVVGLTGSGKTSLINLMLGFYKPTRGEITIGGRPMEAYTLDGVRRAFGIVSQDIYIFPRSIIENIFREDGSSLSGDVGDMLGNLFSEGLHKTIAEDGLNLSEGEKQLISIGRMVAYRPRYVILDEATSRIDRYLEQRIRGIMETEFPSSTWIVIAHRMSTMAEMDRVVVIDDGRLVEEGTHEQLLDKKGIYHHLYSIYLSRSAYEDLYSAARRNNVE